MPLAPGYGETPLDPEEADALTTQARELLGDDPTKADLYEAEQAVFVEVPSTSRTKSRTAPSALTRSCRITSSAIFT
jgi:hypothetical protein